MVAAPPAQLLNGTSALLRRLEALEPHRTVFAMPSGGIYFFWQLGGPSLTEGTLLSTALLEIAILPQWAGACCITQPGSMGAYIHPSCAQGSCSS